MALSRLNIFGRSSGPVPLTSKISDEERKKMDEKNKKKALMAAHPRRAGKYSVNDAATVLGIEPFEFADLKANVYDMFTGKQDYSIQSKHCEFMVGTKPSWAHKPLTEFKFFRVATFAIIWIALKSRSKGTVTITIKDTSYTTDELQTEVKIKYPLSKNFAVLGSLPDFMAVEDRDKLIVSVEVNDETLKNCVFSRSIWFWGVEQTDLPIAMKPQDVIMFEYEPLDNKGLNNLNAFKDFTTKVATNAVTKAFKQRQLPELEDDFKYGVQVQPERVRLERSPPRGGIKVSA
ncbi:pC4 [European wheat striate mosaic virus]|uniref:PC4 n=1 Tax=European wheat striate mosaic virus TaxID=2661631 RepID=A0A5P9KBH7_9VIRU|nr:NScv4 [European wheat striate mosaic virus]QFU19995.1 pC4 [European wheat striate mosaic virus]QFU19997.1 pC4 [European wheat striate mosaic virus]QFU19999.1 pC4 [European wheat striate mosaic virus]QFU20001.1 pC4 [European wheat striate mosaic virus]QFU20005.1 pC4 [European wheat striate mosaic virus]